MVFMIIDLFSDVLWVIRWNPKKREREKSGKKNRTVEDIVRVYVFICQQKREYHLICSRGCRRWGEIGAVCQEMCAFMCEIYDTVLMNDVVYVYVYEWMDVWVYV